MTTLEDERFVNSESETFDENMTFEQYRKGICKYLIHCSWNYSAKEAAEIVKMYDNFVREAFENKESIAHIALDIGYGCG